MAGKSISRKLLLAGLVFLVVIVFFVGFGIMYAIKVPFHSRGNMGLGGSMSLYLLDPEGHRIPIKSGGIAGDIIYKYKGKTVSAIAYNATLSFTAKNGDSVKWEIQVKYQAIDLRSYDSVTHTSTSSDTITMSSDKKTISIVGRDALSDILKGLNIKDGDQIKISVSAIAYVQDLNTGQSATAVSDTITFYVTAEEDGKVTIQSFQIQPYMG